MSSTDTIPIKGFDPLDPQINSDPYPTYRWLRDNAPVYYNAHRRFWALSRFDDVHAAARNWEALSNADGVELDDGDAVFGAGDGNFLISDPPRHDELRDVVRRHFAPRAVLGLEDTVRELARDLICRSRDKSTVDFAADLALELPLRTGAALLGFPAADHGQLKSWFRDLSSRTPHEIVVPERTWQAARAFRAYIADAVRERQRHRSDDVLSTMVDAMDDDGAMSASEIQGASILLFGAAIMTTSSLLTNSMFHLTQQPRWWAWLKENRAQLPHAIEEFLRYDTPAQWLRRTTTRAYALHGQIIPKGERVLLLYASANRDERRFEDAETLDLRRKPERHLAFGNGIHFCLGAPLARLEARIFYEEWLAQIDRFEVAGPVERHFSPAERGWSHLPLSVRYTKSRDV